MAGILWWDKDNKYVKDDKVIYEDMLYKRTDKNRPPDEKCYKQIRTVDANVLYNNGDLVIADGKIFKLDFSNYNGISQDKLNTEYWKLTDEPVNHMTSSEFKYKKDSVINARHRNYKCIKDIAKIDNINSYPFMTEVDSNYWDIMHVKEKFTYYDHTKEYKHNDLIYIPPNRYKRTDYMCKTNIYRKGVRTEILLLSNVAEYNNDPKLGDIIKIKQGSNFTYYKCISYAEPNIKNCEWVLFFDNINISDYSTNINKFNLDMVSIFSNYYKIKMIILESLDIKYYAEKEKNKIFIKHIIDHNLCNDYFINSIINKDVPVINEFIFNTMLINNKIIIAKDCIKITCEQLEIGKIFDILLLIHPILTKYNKEFCHKLLTNSVINISNIINQIKGIEGKYLVCISYFRDMLSNKKEDIAWADEEDEDDRTISVKNAGINSYIYSELLKNNVIDTKYLRYMNFFELSEILIDYKGINVPCDIINVYKLLYNYYDIDKINNIVNSVPIISKAHSLSKKKFDELKSLINTIISKYNSLSILMMDVLNMITNCITLFVSLQQLYHELYSNYKIHIDSAINYIEYYCDTYNKDFLYNFNCYYMLYNGYMFDISIPKNNELYTIKKINNLLYKIKKSFGSTPNRAIINSIKDLISKYNTSKHIIYLQCMFNLLKLYDFGADHGDPAEIKPIKSFNTNIYLKNIVKHNTRMDDFIYTNFDYPDKVKIYLLTGGNNTKKLMGAQDLYYKITELT